MKFKKGTIKHKGNTSTFVGLDPWKVAIDLYKDDPCAPKIDERGFFNTLTGTHYEWYSGGNLVSAKIEFINEPEV
jgi:hypothetical protein